MNWNFKNIVMCLFGLCLIVGIFFSNDFLASKPSTQQQNPYAFNQKYLKIMDDSERQHSQDLQREKQEDDCIRSYIAQGKSPSFYFTQCSMSSTTQSVKN